jgi:hypothetical protein
MSDTVKRWLGGGPTYTLEVVAAADYDAVQTRAAKAEAERDGIQRTSEIVAIELAQVMRERDNLASRIHLLIIRDAWNFALADPVEDVSPFYYCELKKTVGCNGTAGPHGYGRCVERRKGKP